MTEEANTGTTAYTRTHQGELVGSRSSGSSNAYFVLDSLGSVVGLFDKSGAFGGGYSYSPYGENRSSSNTTATNANALRYIASYFDTSVSLYRLGARYYDPTQGRFTQFDPSGQEANPYAYAGGDPIGNNDPTGLSAAGAAVGAAISTGLSAAATGVACAVTAVVGCVVAGLAAGAIFGAFGGVAQSYVEGRTRPSQVRGAAVDGAVSGFVSSAVGGVVGKVGKAAKAARAVSRS